MHVIERDSKLPHYSDLVTCPNSRQAHQLQRFRNGTGMCSCERWSLEGASEPSLIRSHQFHVSNHAHNQFTKEVTSK
jgi:hypothetical protein